MRLTPLMVRLPEALHRKLVRLASAGGHSLNFEIVRRLEHSVAVESPLSADAQKILDRVKKGMDEQNELIVDVFRRLMGGRKGEEGEDK
jgi:predicted transcriptional regulator